jgi:polysaccharide export outer membrane protein
MLISTFACSIKTPHIETIPDSELETTTDQAKDLSIGVGDELEVRLYRHENMTRKILVPASGVIYYPLAGEVNVTNNMGVNELRNTLTERLKPFIVNPEVNVEVLNQRSQKIFVLGEVTKAGPFPMDSKIRAVEAISRAGGFTLDASESSVVLVRNDSNKTRMKVLDLKNIINGEGHTDNVALRPGDIVYVPRSFVADLDKFFTHIQKGIITGLMIEQGIVLWPAVIDAIEGVTNATTTNVVVTGVK